MRNDWTSFSVFVRILSEDGNGRLLVEGEYYYERPGPYCPGGLELDIRRVLDADGNPVKVPHSRRAFTDDVADVIFAECLSSRAHC